MGIQLNVTYNSTSQNKVGKGEHWPGSVWRCQLASMISSHFTQKLNNFLVCLQTLQEIMNIQPNLTSSSGSCNTSSALLKLTTDAEKTNLTFIFTLVTDVICSSQ